MADDPSSWQDAASYALSSIESVATVRYWTEAWIDYAEDLVWSAYVGAWSPFWDPDTFWSGLLSRFSELETVPEGWDKLEDLWESLLGRELESESVTSADVIGALTATGDEAGEALEDLVDRIPSPGQALELQVLAFVGLLALWAASR